MSYDDRPKRGIKNPSTKRKVVAGLIAGIAVLVVIGIIRVVAGW